MIDEQVKVLEDRRDRAAVSGDPFAPRADLAASVSVGDDRGQAVLEGGSDAAVG